MSTIEEIEKAVEALPAGDLAKFRTWFHQFEAESWDAKFERDVRAGRLEGLADAALGEHDRGETQPI